MKLAWAMVVTVEVAKSGQVLDVFLKRQQREYADEMDVGCERKRGGMDDSKAFIRATGKTQLPSTEMVKSSGLQWFRNSTSQDITPVSCLFI